MPSLPNLRFLVDENVRKEVTDFLRPLGHLMYPPEEYSGIIRIKIHPPSAPAIINALKDFLSKISPDKLDKKLVILEEDGFRIK